MDQDPKTAGGTDTANTVPGEPGQNASTTTEQQPTATAPQAQISRPVDSNHINRDLRLPGDKPQRRTHLILGIIIGVIVATLAGATIWFFAFYNSPEKVLFDGVNHLFRAPNISFTGEGAFYINTDNMSDSSLKGIVINLDSSSSKLPNATDVTLSVIPTDGQTFNLQLGTVQMSDGIIYLRIDGIMDSLRALGAEEYLVEDVLNIAEIVDGEWWRISVRDVIENLTGSSEYANYYGELYDCALSASTRGNSSTLTDLYSKYRFISVKPSDQPSNSEAHVTYEVEAWHNLYEISIDRSMLADFINALPDTESARELIACYNTTIQKYDPGAGELSLDDYIESSADDISIPDALHLYAEISQFGHKIRSVWAYIDNGDWNSALSLNLKYQSTDVSAPSEYRDFTELFEELSLDDIWGSTTYPDDIDYDDNYEYDDMLMDNEIEEIEWES